MLVEDSHFESHSGWKWNWPQTTPFDPSQKDILVLKNCVSHVRLYHVITYKTKIWSK